MLAPRPVKACDYQISPKAAASNLNWSVFAGLMNTMAYSIVIIPGVVALLLCLLFSYLYLQSRQAYFRAWQIAWACYSIHYALDAFRYYYPPARAAFLLSSLFSVAMAVCIFVSTRLTRTAFRFRWYDWALAAAGVGAACGDLRVHLQRALHASAERPVSLAVIFLSAVLLYSSAVFFLHAHRRGSVAFQLLAFSLAFWAVLLGAIQYSNPWAEMFGMVGHVLGPVPQMLLGIAMVMVLFENERNAVQENTLALSTLGVDPRRLLSADDLLPSMQAALDRLAGALSAKRAVIYISERWRGLLPSVQRGFSAEFLAALTTTGAGEYICDLAYRQGGLSTAHDLPHMKEQLPIASTGTFADFKKVFSEAEIRNLTAVSLQTREHAFGVIVFPHAERKAFGASGPRLMVGLALQLGLTLDNYLMAHDAHRRTQEYELLTEIGKAISSRLDQDEVLRTIHTELGQIFNTSNFYIAFQEGRRAPLRTRSGERSNPAQAHTQAGECLQRICDPDRPAAADTLRVGEGPHAPGSDLPARASREMPVRCAYSAGQQARGRDGCHEHRTRVCLRTAGSGSAGDRRRAGFGCGGECPPVRR